MPCLRLGYAALVVIPIKLPVCIRLSVHRLPHPCRSLTTTTSQQHTKNKTHKLCRDGEKVSASCCSSADVAKRCRWLSPRCYTPDDIHIHILEKMRAVVEPLLVAIMQLLDIQQHRNPIRPRTQPPFPEEQRINGRNNGARTSFERLCLGVLGPVKSGKRQA